MGVSEKRQNFHFGVEYPIKTGFVVQGHMKYCVYRNTYLIHWCCNEYDKVCSFKILM